MSKRFPNMAFLLLNYSLSLSLSLYIYIYIFIERENLTRVLNICNRANMSLKIENWKVDAATFEVNKTNHSLDIMKKQFKRQLSVSPRKQTFLCNTYTKEKHFTFSLRRNIIGDTYFQYIIYNFVRRFFH